MESYFEILQSHDLLKRGHINDQKIFGLSRKQLENISNQLLEANVPVKRSSIEGLSHCASLNLTGDPYECPEIECRSKRLDKLARFASLHSSRVYIYNFFDELMHYSEDVNDLRYIFKGNVALSLQIRSLLESGIISFSPVRGIACPDCLSKIINGENAKKGETDHAISAISRELFANSELIAKLNSKPIIEIHGKEPYFNCISISPLEEVPNWLKPYLSKKGTKLPTKIAKRLGFHESKAFRIFTNVSFELALSDSLGASVLFDNPLHISFIEKISKDSEIERKNIVALKHMTTVMPFADNVPINKILELREKEPESFLEFQRALRDGMVEFEKSKNLKESQARSMYAEIIQPALNKLDLTFKNAQRSLIKDVYRNAIAAIGSLSVGVLAGSITNGFVPALAGAIFAQKTIKSAMGMHDESKEIKNDKFYFLWKVKRNLQH